MSTPEDGVPATCALNFDHVSLAQRERILAHLGLPTTLPAVRPARASPLRFGADAEPS